MEDDSKTILQETFDHLPQDVQEVIFSDDYPVILAEIEKEFNMTPEQSKKFEIETTGVLMGVAKRQYFQFDLEFDLGIDEDVAENISKKVSDTIFATVDESLKKMESTDIGDEQTLQAKLDYEEKRAEAENPEDAKKPDTTLTTLADRLKQASIASPAKRDYSLSRSSGSSPSNALAAADSPQPSIDPYHEPIDNE